MTFQKAWPRGLIYLALICFAAYYLMPIYLLVITGLKTDAEINIDWMWRLPTGLHFDGFAQAWPRVSANFVNSVLITVPSAIISAIIGSMNGYIFAKWKFRWSHTIFLLFLVGMFLPYQGILIPLVQTLQMSGALIAALPTIIVYLALGKFFR